MTQRPRALVVGGSVGGLIAAHLLRAIGWHVMVFEGLADSLNRSDIRLKGGLAGYERERRRFGRELVAYARTLGLHLEAQPNTRRRPIRPWQPEIIMRNYGAPRALRKPEMAVTRKDTNDD